MGTHVAVIGTGSVGVALAGTLARGGLAVSVGSRRARSARDLGLPEAPVLAVTDPVAACAGAEVDFLAVPSADVLGVAAGLELKPGTMLVDCTNPVAWDEGPTWRPPAQGSVAAALASALPEVRVVKGFNSFGAERHAHPDLGGSQIVVLLAGDDPDVVATVAEVARRAGFRPRPAGPLRNAALLENLAVLWIHLAQKEGLGRQFAFQVVTPG